MNPYIFPAECGFARRAEDVGHSMKTGQQKPFFGLSAADVHTAIAQSKSNMLLSWNIL